MIISYQLKIFFNEPNNLISTNLSSPGVNSPCKWLMGFFNLKTNSSNLYNLC